MTLTTPEIESVIDKLVAFVQANKGGRNKVYDSWSKEQMENAFRHSMLHMSLLYASNEVGEIVGIVHGVADESKRVFHVINIIAKAPNVLPSFIARFTELWPGYTLKAERRGHTKTYDTFGLIRKILHLPIDYSRN